MNITEYISQFDKVIEHFKHEMSGLRTGRASANLVDGIMVESYGQKMPISHMASINIPDAKTIAIQAWDKSNLAAIEKAIAAANIGINPVNDGILIRLSIPPMTEERRKEMVKMLGRLVEQARISVRNVREDAVKGIKREEDDNTLTSDDVEVVKDKVQQEVDKYNLQIKELAELKEKEIMTI